MKKDRWQEISRLYYAALELPEAERDSLLNGCEDEDLRREVLSLLADESLAGSFLEERALDVAKGLRAKKRQSLIGSQLGAYRVISEIGSGGMGEVYKAQDTKLGRHVAIKVLSEEFAQDDLRLARFRREAKLLAALNHPNIAAIHGLEESGDTHYLILELIEGETLADLIERGPIPVEESLKLVLQIAEALDVAHEKGVIHRDLKPDNIKVTPEGKVKVLDFGLAKAYAADAPDRSRSDLPTTSVSDTLQGVILGTASYMSPEQARGKPVDKRTDIWAFGCVLYEMLAGYRAFSGRDTTEILAAVIRAEPDWSRLPAKLHWRLKEVLDRCLEKEEKDRYGAISDVRADIQKALADFESLPPRRAGIAGNRTKLRVGLWWIAVVFILGSIMGAVVVWKRELSQPPGKELPVAFVQELPEGSRFNIDLEKQGGTLAVSDDGKQFVCSANDGLYLRSLGETEWHGIEGTDVNSKTPFFSPDGNWIGYWCQTDGKLKKINLHGGSPLPICDVNHVAGAIWLRNHTILYSDIDRGILQVSDKAGTPKELAEGIFSTPQLLPDGKTLLFTETISRVTPRIILQPSDSEKRTILLPDARSPRYLPSSGHIVYILGTDLMIAPFDPQKLEITGEAHTLVEKAGSYAISDSTLVFRPPTLAESKDLYTSRPAWVNLDGEEETLDELQPDTYTNPRFSPKGEKVALTIGKSGNGNTLEIGVWDTVSKTLNKLTSNEHPDNVPIWYNDDIIFFWSRSENPGIYRVRADGNGEAKLLCPALEDPLVPLLPYALSKDGKTLLIIKITLGGLKNQDVLALSLDGKRTPVPLLQEDYVETLPRISPDGRWMAYMSHRSGKYEIYVRPFPEATGIGKQVSTGGGLSPLWSPDGTRLFYLSGDAAMEVSVNTKQDFRYGKPTALFHKTYLSYWPPEMGAPWDIHPDGDRFLIVKNTEKENSKSVAEAPSNFTVVVNWREKLNHEVPVN